MAEWPSGRVAGKRVGRSIPTQPLQLGLEHALQPSRHAVEIRRSGYLPQVDVQSINAPNFIVRRQAIKQCVQHLRPPPMQKLAELLLLREAKTRVRAVTNPVQRFDDMSAHAASPAACRPA